MKERTEFVSDENKKRVQTMALTTFYEYRAWLYPGHSCQRKKEDVCDHCIRLKLIMENVLATEAEKEQAKKELEMHLEASINQRRAVKHYMVTYLDNLCIPAQPIRLPYFIDGDDDGEEQEMRMMRARERAASNCNHGDCSSGLEARLRNGNGISEIDELLGLNVNNNNEDEDEENNLPTPPPQPTPPPAALDDSQYMALVTAEDYGMSGSFPHYGQIRPQSDYFNSNLNWHNFVMSDISRSENNIFLYDERTMGKDKQALCSLRLNFHIENLRRCERENKRHPEIFISIWDNCVGQNKSNTTMQFDAFLSLSLYKRVLVIFFIPGHSHMIPDRVVAWMKAGIKNKNIYNPNDLEKEINKVKNIKANFFAHTDRWRPCFDKWDQFLGKHLKKLPAGFTNNYVFEFFKGEVTMKHLITENETKKNNLCKLDESTTRRNLWNELFGGTRKQNVTMQDVTLPRLECKELDINKIKSLAKKYHSIPAVHRWFYPSISDDVVSQAGEENVDEVEANQEKTPSSKKKRRAKKQTPGVKTDQMKKKGRRYPEARLDENQPTIMDMFKSYTPRR